MSTFLSLDRERSSRSANRRNNSEYYNYLSPALAEYASLGPQDPRRTPLRDELVIGYLPIVQHVARRYGNRGEPLADLEQVGTIGLLNALDRFDPQRGDDFLAFAIPTIIGEMRRHFRDRTWATRVPRRLKDLQTPLREAVAALSALLGRAPRPREIAHELGITADEVIEALNAQQAYCWSSLDSLAGDSGTTLADVMGEVDESLELAQYRHGLRRALDDLPERERTVVILRFFGELTQTQIAARIGLSQMQVSRLLAKTLAALRARLDAD